MAVDFKPGMFMLAETKKVQNEETYGRVLYIVREVGLPRPLTKPDGTPADEMDGVKVEMLGGTGPSARKGQVIIDYEERLNEDIRKGIVKVIPENQADQLAKTYRTTPEVQMAPNAQRADVEMPRHGGTGVVKFD